ncbi:MAG: PAS domain-containing sensor histidine kinase [Sulfuricurvum sp.]|nr:PAS domain-containing sensor histidine kinase [Sulfuricurvum sp.]MDD5386806.1 PAS domain-containing sensor histidine kinase [Sulfuricurvum sp.]
MIKKDLLLTQYKNALDASLHISKTDPAGIITYVNEKFCQLSGYKEEEIIGQTHRLFKHPDTTKEQMDDLWRTVSSQQIWHGTVTNQTKTGEPFYTDTFIVPIVNERNEIEEYMDMRIDVTELETHLRTLQIKIDKATQEIKDQQERLISQSRSAALGEMFDNIAHQWRQPIAAINNAIINAEFALELGGMSTEEILETFRQINTYTAFLSGTIDDFRNFSNPDKEKTWFTPHEIIQQTIEILHGSLDANTISLLYTPSKEEQLLKIYGSSGEFSQVILNILSNARDALKEHTIKNGHILIALTRKEDSIFLQIADNAGGILQTVLPKIFDPYFSTKNKAQGTGIGLYMSKTIIEKHFNGKLEAKNEGEGAVFTITIPMP